MLDLLLAAVALLLLVGGAGLVVLALVVAPFVVGCDRAEARGGSPARAGALVLAAAAVALLVVLVALRTGGPLVAAVLPLGLPWLAVALVVLLPDRAALLGRPGQHEAGRPEQTRPR